MGTVHAVASPPRLTPGHPRTRGGAPGTAGGRLAFRLVRRGALAITLALAGLMLLETYAFTSGYPDPASRVPLTVWAQDPGVRILSGPGYAVDTVGGFAVWDGGLYLTLILAAWALTTTTRLLRGDEDAGRTELMLAGPARSTRVLRQQLLVLLSAAAFIGTAVGLSLALSGADVAGSVVFGAAMLGYAGALIGLAAVLSQVFATRVGALASSGGVFAIWVLLRMFANSADARAWLGWLTPLGWTDRLHAFEDNRWPYLLLPLAAIVVLAALATALRAHRDAGTGLLAEREAPPSRGWALGSPLAFAWRASVRVLLAWAAGVAVAALVVGALMQTVEENLANDVSFREMLASMGMDAADLTLGFISMWAVIIGLVVAVYSAFRVGAARAEEASTRVDLLFSRPVRRGEWLAGHVTWTVVSVAVLLATASSALWAGGALSGAGLTASDAFAAMFNPFPAVMVFAGLAVLVFGVAPRLTVALGAAVAVLAYVVELVGQMLEWPDWVLGLSPFHHLTEVPVEGYGLQAGLIMLAIGVVLAALGMLAFGRRDLVGE